MGTEALAAVAIGTAIAGATTSAAAAIQQNRAVKRSKAAAARAADTQRDQIREQAAQEKRERAKQAERVRALLRVRGAAAGTGAGSSYESLAEAADLELQEDFSTIDQNVRNLFARVSSGLNVDLTELGARRRNAVLDSLGGGIGGGQAGLSIGGGIKDLTA